MFVTLSSVCEWDMKMFAHVYTYIHNPCIIHGIRQWFRIDERKEKSLLCLSLNIFWLWNEFSLCRPQVERSNLESCEFCTIITMLCKQTLRFTMMMSPYLYKGVFFRDIKLLWLMTRTVCVEGGRHDSVVVS